MEDHLARYKTLFLTGPSLKETVFRGAELYDKCAGTINRKTNLEMTPLQILQMRWSELKPAALSYDSYRETRLSFVSKILEREIQSFRNLTEPEVMLMFGIIDSEIGKSVIRRMMMEKFFV